MRHLVRLTVFLAAATLPGTDLQGQEGDGADDGLRPALGPHRFVTNPVVRDPFPRTFVRNSLGIGTATDLPIVPKFEISPGDTIGGITGNLLFALLDFEYQQRIKDWMGFWVDVNLRGRLGDDVGALLAEGITVSTGFEIGWMFRVHQSERTALSLTAQVRNNNLTGVNILDFLKGVIDSTNVPLVQKVPTLRAGSEARFAWAANTWLGVTATALIEYGETADRSEANSTSASIGVAADVDLGPLLNAPVGLVVAGQRALSPDRALIDVANASLGLLRISYTGRPDFLISLDIGVARAPLKDVTVTTTSTRVSMRYYF